jgi:hypothetical protein
VSQGVQLPPSHHSPASQSVSRAQPTHEDPSQIWFDAVQSSHAAPQWVLVSQVRQTFELHHWPTPPLQSELPLQSTQAVPSALQTSLLEVQFWQLGPQCGSTLQATQLSEEHHWPLEQSPSALQSTQVVPLHTSPLEVQFWQDAPQWSSTSQATQSSPTQ